MHYGILTKHSFLKQKAILGHFLLWLTGRTDAVLQLLLQLCDLIISQTHRLQNNHPLIQLTAP